MTPEEMIKAILQQIVYSCGQEKEERIESRQLNTVDDAIDMIAGYTLQFLRTVNTEVFKDTRLDLIDPATLNNKIIQRMIEKMQCDCPYTRPVYAKIINYDDYIFSPSKIPSDLMVLDQNDFLNIVKSCKKYIMSPKFEPYSFLKAMRILIYRYIPDMHIRNATSYREYIDIIKERRDIIISLDKNLVTYKLNLLIAYFKTKLYEEEPSDKRKEELNKYLTQALNIRDKYEEILKNI